MIEVELRSFLTKHEYENLNEFLSNNAKFIEEDNQETYYYDCIEDLRIQRNNSGSKIWLKKGNLHDDYREEIEIKTNLDDFENLKNLFHSLGYKVEIGWFRYRKTFKYKGVSIMLDFTKDYGYIIELELLVDKNQVRQAKTKLQLLRSELKINKTSKDEFSKRFEEYKQNWSIRS